MKRDFFLKKHAGVDVNEQTNNAKILGYAWIRSMIHSDT